jgi:hypothetical protein
MPPRARQGQQQLDPREWFRAIEEGDMDTINQYLDQGFDVNTMDHTGVSAFFNIFHSFSPNQKEIIRRLLDANADMYLNMEPLGLAIEVGSDIETLQMLLDHGADVNRTEYGDKTPLQFSLHFISKAKISDLTLDNHWIKLEQDTALLFLENGADPNYAPYDTMPPLSMLLQPINRIRENEISQPTLVNINEVIIPILEMLLEKGAEVDDHIQRQYLRGYYTPQIREILAPHILYINVNSNNNDNNYSNINNYRNNNNNNNRARNDLPQLPDLPNAPRNQVENHPRLDKCFDFVEFDNINVKEYLRETKNNILLVQPNQILCMNRNNLPVKRFYACRSASGNFGPAHIIGDQLYTKIGENNYVISEEDLLLMRDTDFDVFVLHETDTTLAALASYEIIHPRPGQYPNIVSADHCTQPYPLYRLEAFSLSDYVAREGGKRKNRTKKNKKIKKSKNNKKNNKSKNDKTKKSNHVAKRSCRVKTQRKKRF